MIFVVDNNYIAIHIATINNKMELLSMKENKITTYVDEELYKKISDDAVEMGLTISAYIRVLLIKYYNKKMEG